MKDSYRIYKGVKLGKNAQIGDYVIIGLPPKGKNDGELETIIGDNAIIRSHTVIYAGNVIGDNFQTGHRALIREDNSLGDNVSIGSGTEITFSVRIGDKARVHSNVFIPEYTILEEGCWVGPNVVLTNAIHPLCPKVKDCLKGPTIKAGAIIGANSTILPHVVVGEGALVGSGSVVVKDVAPGKVVCGNPARVVRDKKELICRFGITDKPY